LLACQRRTCSDNGRVQDIERVAAAIDDELRARSVPGRAEKERAYLKSTLTHYGTPVPDIRVVAKRHGRDLTRDEVLDLVRVLWREPVHERRTAAVEVLALRRADLRLSDVPLLERLIRESHTWALVDPLAVTVVGSLAERDAGMGEVLDRWATDDDFWVLRSSLLALLVPLRRGEGDFARFARYADTMLDEREFFIRKAIGWVLRETGRMRPELVYDWLLPRAQRASGVTVREAVKPLSPVQRDAILRARSRTDLD
jgi:3-methyladenine DNA glycosylase AlkD